MGVTIHFEGRLKSESELSELTQVVVDFARANDMLYRVINEEKLLERFDDEDEWVYTGLVQGIMVELAEDADPLWLEFDADLCVQNFCKTQFAGIGIHTRVVELLSSLEALFTELFVFDEGEYWETRSESLLLKNLTDCFQAIEKRKAEVPAVSGPYKMENGRMIDLIED